MHYQTLEEINLTIIAGVKIYIREVNYSLVASPLTTTSLLSHAQNSLQMALFYAASCTDSVILKTHTEYFGESLILCRIMFLFLSFYLVELIFADVDLLL